MGIKKVLITLFVLIVVVASGLSTFVWYMHEAGNNDDYFESEIKAFEQADLENFPAPDQILFVGSSSIRFWDSLSEDMAPLSTIRRGFGGAHMSHVLYNFDRIVSPYKPKAIVVFVGGNDIGWGKSPERLLADYLLFIDRVNQDLPDTDVWILSMKPSKLRWSEWPKMQRVDDGFAELANQYDNVTLVYTGRTLFDHKGQPDDVYIFDGLHLNDEGYRRWTQYLKPLLLERYSS